MHLFWCKKYIFSNAKKHLFKCKNYIYFGVKITSNIVVKIHFFTVIHKYYSRYLYAVFRCKKDSGSTWDFKTHVKSIFFTVDIFTVSIREQSLRSNVNLGFWEGSILSTTTVLFHLVMLDDLSLLEMWMGKPVTITVSGKSINPLTLKLNISHNVSKIKR